MKKLLFILTISFLALEAGYPQTYVSGGIYSNTVWTLANSPYVVTDTVVVFPGVTLTIEPGVTVKFDNNVVLEIRQAKIIAQGTVTDSITFTSNSSSPTPGIWDEIFLNNCTSTINFNYCNFQYAAIGINNHYTTGTGIVIIKNSSFRNNNTGLSGYCYFSIESCNFYNNYVGANPYYSKRIKNCNFLNNTDYGCHVGYSDSISNCIFNSNNEGLYMDYGYYTKIVNCKAFFNTLYGFDILVASSSGSVNLIGCNASFNQDGIMISGKGKIVNCIADSNNISGITKSGIDTINNCEIKYNRIGILHYTGNNCIITKNIIEENIIGIKLFDVGNTISCNKICNNTNYDFCDSIISGSNINITNNYWCTTDSTIIASHIYDGYDNINLSLAHFIPIDTVQCYLFPCSANFNLYPDTAILHQYWAVNLASGVPPLTYLWSWGDGTTDTIALPSHTYSTAGYYNICLTITDSAGCTHTYCDSSYLSKNIDAMVYVNVILPTGITESSLNKSFLIYPNPASDYLTLKFAQNTSKAEIKIYNLLGELKSTSRKSSTESVIDISDLSNGVYIIEVATEKNITRQKFIKQ